MASLSYSVRGRFHYNSLGLAYEAAPGDTNAGAEVHRAVSLTTTAVATGCSQDTAGKHKIRASNTKTLCFGALESREGSSKDSENGEIHFLTGPCEETCGFSPSHNGLLLYLIAWMYLCQ